MWYLGRGCWGVHVGSGGCWHQGDDRRASAMQAAARVRKQAGRRAGHADRRWDGGGLTCTVPPGQYPACSWQGCNMRLKAASHGVMGHAWQPVELWRRAAGQRRRRGAHCETMPSVVRSASLAPSWNRLRTWEDTQPAREERSRGAAARGGCHGDVQAGMAEAPAVRSAPSAADEAAAAAAPPHQRTLLWHQVRKGSGVLHHHAACLHLVHVVAGLLMHAG